MDTLPNDGIQLFDTSKKELYQLLCGDIYNAKIHIRGSERNAKQKTHKFR